MNNDPIATLNQQHGIPGRARVVAGRGGLPRIDLTSPGGNGEVYLHGGQITSWTPSAQRDVLFLSTESRWEEGRAIRGGIPICFPWFGARVGDPAAPSHGFVRLKAWQLASIVATADAVRVSLFTESSEETRSRWPADFRLSLHATIGQTLHVELSVRNTGGSDLTCEEALHSYFSVGDAATVSIQGLDGTRYLDKVAGSAEREQVGDIHFSGETDRVYLETTDTVTITDPGFSRRIQVAKGHSAVTVVWNPWVARAKALADFGDAEWRSMTCVETCNVAPHAVTVSPGQQHTMWATLTVEPLGAA